MKKSISAAICGAICLTCSAGVLLQPANCYAEVVEGFAPIVNGDVETARQKARKYAMRSYVESKVGVNVESNTTVDMGLVISDRIVTDSKGYVQIKKVKKSHSVTLKKNLKKKQKISFFGMDKDYNKIYRTYYVGK